MTMLERYAPHDHVVQFYDAQDELAAAVGSYLVDALLLGECAVVIATPAHRAAFDEVVSTLGVDPAAAAVEGRYVVLDAAETLASFIVDGRPDPARFDAVVGGLIRQLVDVGRPVRAYGEMVALLWDAGQVGAAIEVEGLWNHLGSESEFSLFCAYPVASLVAPGLAEAVGDVRRSHSDIVGTCPPWLLDNGDQRALRHFSDSLHSPRDARHFVVGVLSEWGRHDLVDVAALVVTELATNAVLHAGSDFTVGVALSSGAVRIEVEDASTARPIAPPQLFSCQSGRGLALVASLTHDWGVDDRPAGKVVWAVLGD